MRRLRTWLIHRLGGVTQDEADKRCSRWIRKVRKEIEEYVRSEVPESGLVEEHNRGFLRACREIFDELNLDKPMYGGAAEAFRGFQTYAINGKPVAPGRTGRLSFNATRHGP